MAETLRPYSTASSVITPYSALQALAGANGGDSYDDDDYAQHHGLRSNGHSNGHPQSHSGGRGYSSREQLTPIADSEYGASGSGSASGHVHADAYDDDDTSSSPGTPPILVRAKFDFEATDRSALSFSAGDVIQVYSRLESGWWDGMLGGQRGWFPSNYVEEIGEEEARAMELAAEAQAAEAAEAEEENILRMDDVLRGDWSGWGTSEQDMSGLDQLAREMMSGDNSAPAPAPIPAFDESQDDAQGFMQEARRRRARAATGASRMDEEVTGPDEFGYRGAQWAPGDETVKASGSAASVTTARQGLHGGVEEEPHDAWIPSITPDGQVYYHNTKTGEDSWELPEDDSEPMDPDDFYSQSDDQFFSSLPSSSAAAAASRAPPQNDDFGAPPRAHTDLPYPWVTKLSDDGREWFYHNRLTGQSRREPPTRGGDAASIVDIGMGLNRMSVGSSSGSVGGYGSRPPPVRTSVILQRRAVQEWEHRTADALRVSTRPPPAETMGLLMDTVNDSLRGIFEASVAGSAAEEEMSRAEAMGSELGMTAALEREDGAVDALAVAHANTLGAIRRVLLAFGYVGPLDKMEELPRPGWVGDMTLIGSIGMLSATTHAAVTSKKQPESGLSVWSEVMRSASKLKDVIANFPAAVLAGGEVPPGGADAAPGKQLEAWLGWDVLGEPLGGKWGFRSTDTGYRVLDQSAVVDVQKVRAEFEETLRGLDLSGSADVDHLHHDVVKMLRLVTIFTQLITEIDVASVIDIDGDAADPASYSGARAREDALREYDDLVSQARRSLADLDSAIPLINALSISVLHALAVPPREVPAALAGTLDRLSAALTSAFRALPTLNIIAGEQASAITQNYVRGQIGVRSPKFTLPPGHPAGHTRSGSIVSSGSRGSRLSQNRARGLEELLDYEQDEYGEARDLPGEMRDRSASASANASTSSLALGQSGPSQQGQGVAGQAMALGRRPSASSSTTSLAYQPTDSDRDSGSQKGNRSSILKAFRRNRSNSDAVDEPRGMTGMGMGMGMGMSMRGKAQPPSQSKKLAKLLGEDMSTIPMVSVPPPMPSQPEAPWYLMDDFEPGEIIFDDKGGVKAGTLRALVIRLTQHSSTDTPFFQAFLLTFRSFTHALELFGLLVERYLMPEPEGLTPVQLQEWKVKKQAPIRLRVANALRMWLERHYIEQTDLPVLDKIEEFAGTTLLANGSELMSKQLLTLVAKRRLGEPEHTRSGTSGSLLSPPAPLIPRISGRGIRLMDIPALELARQLTVMEFLNFQKIKPSECLSKAWAVDDDESAKMAKNVRAVILSANRMAGWVALCVLRGKEARTRAAVMKLFIHTAIECRSLNNFSSMAGIVAGLNSAPITRLKRTRELLSQKSNNLKADLDKALDSSKNFSNYKAMLKTVNPPCVPFFGFYLSALTFIEDGNRDFIQPGAPTKGKSLPPSNSASSLSSAAAAAALPVGPGGDTVIPTQPLINFFKRGLSAEILRDIAQYQSQPYNLARSKIVQDWIQEGFKEVEAIGDLYDLSTDVEPREKEEERITRMLHDSVSPTWL
ncbi:hypothetical protein IAT38_006045 [Cryptococcus sp. DSM 104549]